MVKGAKRLLVGILAATLALAPVATVSAATSSASTASYARNINATPAKTNQILKSNTKKNGLASIKKVNPKATKITQTTVTIKGVTYDIARVKNGAFKKGKKVKTVVLGKKIKYIEKKAFTGAKKLKTIKYQSTSKLSFVKKTAFKGLNTKSITIKVNKKMSKATFKKLTKQLRKAGFKGKIVRNLKVS